MLNPFVTIEKYIPVQAVFKAKLKNYSSTFAVILHSILEDLKNPFMTKNS